MKDISISAFNGVRNTVPAERVQGYPTKDNPVVDLVEAVNVDINDAMQPQRRDGTTLKRAGASHSIWSSRDLCLFVEGTTLRQLHKSFTDSILKTGIAAGMPMSYVEINDRVYWSNGVQSGVVAEGASREWGMEVPPAPGLTEIRGILTAGTYQAAMTYLREDGQESGTALAARIDIDEGGGVRFAWAAPGGDVVDVCLYLSEPNGMVMYRAGVVAASVGSFDVVTHNTALPLNTQWLDKPPPGQHLTYSNGRIYIAQGPFIFGTAPYGYEYCDLRDYLSLDGSRVDMLLGVEGGLFAGTDKGTYFLTGSRLEEMSMRTLSTSPVIPGSGVIADGMAVTGNKDMAGRRVALYATEDGLHMGMADGSVVNLTGERYTMSVAKMGAAVFRNTELFSQYLLFQQS